MVAQPVLAPNISGADDICFDMVWLEPVWHRLSTSTKKNIPQLALLLLAARTRGGQGRELPRPAYCQPQGTARPRAPQQPGATHALQGWP